MFLAFDCESSDLIKQHLALDDPAQPWPVAIAAELFDDEGWAQEFFYIKVRAEGRKIREGAALIHGISSKEAARRGVSEVTALGMLIGLASQATHVIGHGVDFDKDLIAGAILRRGKPTDNWLRPGLTWLDTMKLSTQLCKIPPKNGSKNGTFKWPSLDEACVKLLSEEPRSGFHNAWQDMQRTKRLFLKLRELGAIEEDPTETQGAST
ncbi:MAG TPA: 3'-5' exonuclease [Xanthobacteraceae bacterium]|nr:3'-5' exonuclease [Xanthobacteraceae bacterium]